MKKLRHKFLSIILGVALIVMFIPSEGFTIFAIDTNDITTTTGLDLSGGSQLCQV